MPPSIVAWAQRTGVGIAHGQAYMLRELYTGTRTVLTRHYSTQRKAGDRWVRPEP
jgi:hypothetical protein